MLYRISCKVSYVFWASRRSAACLAARARICSRMSVASSLSSISDPNWISGSSRVEAALLDELAFGAIVGVTDG